MTAWRRSALLCLQPGPYQTVGRKRPRAKQRNPGWGAALIAGVQSATDTDALANGGAMMSLALSAAARIQGPWTCSSSLSQDAIVLVALETKQEDCTSDNKVRQNLTPSSANSAPWGGTSTTSPPRAWLAQHQKRQGASSSSTMPPSTGQSVILEAPSLLDAPNQRAGKMGRVSKAASQNKLFASPGSPSLTLSHTDHAIPGYDMKFPSINITASETGKPCPYNFDLHGAPRS